MKTRLRVVAALTALFASSGFATAPAQAAAASTVSESCADAGGVRWRAKVTWGPVYRSSNGIDRVVVDKVAWTTDARVMPTDSVVRSYAPDGALVQTLSRTARVDYRNGTRYDSRNPRNPPNGPGKSRVTVRVGKDGDGKPGCTMTFVQPISGQYRLVWSDEFVGATVDRSKWNIENNSIYGYTNKELECWTSRPSNISQAGGVLTIHAAHEPGYRCGKASRDYTSAMLYTKGHADWQYGYFEIRAQLPTQAGTSKGMWPAFWMRPIAGGTGEIGLS